MAGASEAASLKHDLRRGEIIWVLKQDYPHLITFRHLQLALRDRNIPVAKRDLESYLSYLQEAGFVRCERTYDEHEAQDRILAHRSPPRACFCWIRRLRTRVCGFEVATRGSRVPNPESGNPIR
jgi:hypothetical protein